MRRLWTFLLIAAIPVVILTAVYPEKVFRATIKEGRYESTIGADIVAIVRDGCPHCAAFEAYALKNNWQVEYREITRPDTLRMFEELQKVAPSLQQGVPTILIDGKIIQGYEKDENSGEYLKSLLTECQAKTAGCLRYSAFIETAEDVEVMAAAGATCTEKCEADDAFTLNLWIFGTVDLTLLSLPTLSILLGFLDGFNPCAMWVLVTLLTLLINTHDSKKLWIIAGTFLFVSGAVYYLFIAAWLNAFLLIGYNLWVQKVIGLVAIGGGGFYLYKAFGKDPNSCQITDYQRRARIIDRMKQVMGYTTWPAMIVGVSILAISVNMIELVCTAGLPAVFTQILAFNNVGTVARYGYIALYILLYIIDDLVIFAIAVYTLQATGMTTKYRRFTMIFGGVLMYALGLLLIFRPEALTFG